MGIEGIEELKDKDLVKTVHEVVQVLKKQVAEHKILDVGRSAYKTYGVSFERFRAALAQLKEEEYGLFRVTFEQRSSGAIASTNFLALPGITQKEAFETVKLLPKADRYYLGPNAPEEA